MPQSLINENKLTDISCVSFLVGNREKIIKIESVPALEPFDDRVIDFLNALSRNLMMHPSAKTYPDIVTLGFWMRKASMIKLKSRFVTDDLNIHLGRGIAFHIAPSNVPVNYAYSLVAGLITGNINIIRIPSKDFPQVSIINSAINKTLSHYPFISDYIYLVRYGREKCVNDFFSEIADVRIIWGGDNTIAELRKSSMRSRTTEVAFADRYSLSIIDSEMYLSLDNKERFAEEFYNDTYLTDQNACTSPRIVVWTGSKKEEAKSEFWNTLHDIVKKKYTFQPIMGVNKLTNSYLIAATNSGIHVEPHQDNYIIRVKVDDPNDNIMNLKGNSGYFFEYDCDDYMMLRNLCNNTHCQTVGYLGDKEAIIPLLKSGLKGIDRVVPIGKTMDFDLLWDGYNLFERLTRTICILV